MGHSKVKIEATVGADVGKVWSYWNRPEHIVKWNFAVDDWHCPRAENDLKVGGKLKSRMEAKDGSFGFDFEGTYSEVVEPKKIAYTIADGRRVETVFESLGGTTKITTTFDAENQNPIEMQQKGWQAILNNFKKYTEAN
jgi:uncharacterized protein YndB with AHSA1/START domain